MKSLVKKTLYAGLGLVGTAPDTIEHLGRTLAKEADVSQHEGEKIARQFRARSEKAITAIHRTLNSQVNSVVDALHEALRKDMASLNGKRSAKHKPQGMARMKAKVKAKVKAKLKPRRHAGHSTHAAHTAHPTNHQATH